MFSAFPNFFAKMGGTYSNLPQASPEFPYFTCTFQQPDKLRFVQADQSVISAVLQAAEGQCSTGLQSHGLDQGGVYEVKLKGYPFAKGSKHQDSLQAKRLCCQILCDFYALGWNLEFASDLSRTNDLSTWFFKKVVTERARREIMCLSLSKSDSLQLIMAPASLWPCFKEAVGAGYHHMGGIQEVKEFGADLELKLRGYPWSSSDRQEIIHAQRALLAVIRAFDRQKCHFYGTANIKGTADCLFFISDDSLPSNVFQYSIMSLSSNDKIRMVDSCEIAISDVRRSICQYWKLQGETDLSNANAWEFQLKGCPWDSEGYEAVGSRRLVTKILQNLLKSGWSVLTALDMSRKETDKSIFVLRSCQPLAAPHFCVSLNEMDKIRLIDAPQEIQTMVKKSLLDGWTPGLHSMCPYGDSLQFKLNGYPWNSPGVFGFGNEPLAARWLMSLLLKRLEDAGWRVVCSADVSSKFTEQGSKSKTRYTDDVHSWFLVHMSLAPGTLPSAGSSQNAQELQHSAAKNIEKLPSSPPSYGQIFKD